MKLSALAGLVVGLALPTACYADRLPLAEGPALSTDGTPVIGMARAVATPMFEEVALASREGGFYLWDRQTQTVTTLWEPSEALLDAINSLGTRLTQEGKTEYGYEPITFWPGEPVLKMDMDARTLTIGFRFETGNADGPGEPCGDTILPPPMLAICSADGIVQAVDVGPEAGEPIQGWRLVAADHTQFAETEEPEWDDAEYGSFGAWLDNTRLLVQSTGGKKVALTFSGDGLVGRGAGSVSVLGMTDLLALDADTTLTPKDVTGLKNFTQLFAINDGGLDAWVWDAESASLLTASSAGPDTLLTGFSTVSYERDDNANNRAVTIWGAGGAITEQLRLFRDGEYAISSGDFLKVSSAAALPRLVVATQDWARRLDAGMATAADGSALTYDLDGFDWSRLRPYAWNVQPHAVFSAAARPTPFCVAVSADQQVAVGFDRSISIWDINSRQAVRDVPDPASYPDSNFEMAAVSTHGSSVGKVLESIDSTYFLGFQSAEDASPGPTIDATLSSAAIEYAADFAALLVEDDLGLDSYDDNGNPADMMTRTPSRTSLVRTTDGQVLALTFTLDRDRETQTAAARSLLPEGSLPDGLEIAGELAPRTTCNLMFSDEAGRPTLASLGLPVAPAVETASFDEFERATGQNSVLSMAGESDGGRLALAFRNGSLSVYSLLERTMLWSAQPSSPATRIVWVGDTVATLHEDGSVQLWAPDTGQSISLGAMLPGHSFALAASPNGQYLAVLASGSMPRPHEHGGLWEYVSVVDLDTLEVSSPADLAGTSSIPDQCSADWMFSVDDQGVSSVESAEDLYNPAFLSEISLLSQYVFSECQLGVAELPDGRYGLEASYWVQDVSARNWTLAALPSLPMLKQAGGRLFGVRDEQSLLAYSADDLNLEWSVPIGPQSQYGVETLLAGKLVALLHEDGSIELYDAVGGRLTATLLANADGTWIINTPEGYFASSPGRQNAISFAWGVGTYGLSQLQGQLKRPDLVALALSDPTRPLIDQIREEQRLDLRQMIVDGPPPRIAFRPVLSQAPDTEGNVEVVLELTDQGGGIGGVKVQVNGRPIDIGCGIDDDVAAKGGSASECGFEFTQDNGFSTLPVRLKLASGYNVLSAQAYAPEGSLPSESAVLPVEVAEQLQRPRLHVLAIGVDDYGSAAGVDNLNFARNDAEEVSQLFGEIAQANDGAFYEDYVVHPPLLDAAVTRENVAAAFDKLALEVRPGDAFILLASGHGTTDSEGRFVFLQSDFERSSGDETYSDGLSAEFWVQNLNKLVVQHALVIFDACASGSFAPTFTQVAMRSTPDLSDALDRFNDSFGRHFISAAQSQQVAMEGYQGHGVLTFALLEGLRGAAESQAPAAQLTVREIKNYVEERVETIVREQFPTIHQRVEASEVGYDFDLTWNVEKLGLTPMAASETASGQFCSGADMSAISDAMAIDTMEAYSAYLEAFPQGCQARLAAANLAQLLEDAQPERHAQVVGGLEAVGLATGGNRATTFGAAMTQFQTILGLPATGVPSIEQQDMLANAAALGTTPVLAEAALGLDDETWARMRFEFEKAGQMPFDGDEAALRESIYRFQLDNGRPTSGYVDQALLDTILGTPVAARSLDMPGDVVGQSGDWTVAVHDDGFSPACFAYVDAADGVPLLPIRPRLAYVTLGDGEFMALVRGGLWLPQPPDPDDYEDDGSLAPSDGPVYSASVVRKGQTTLLAEGLVNEFFYAPYELRGTPPAFDEQRLVLVDSSYGADASQMLGMVSKGAELVISRQDDSGESAVSFSLIGLSDAVAQANNACGG